MNIIKTVVLALTLSLCANPSQAGDGAVSAAVHEVYHHPFLGLMAGAYLESVTHKTRVLVADPNETQVYFDEHPQDFVPIKNHILHALAHPISQAGYDRYANLAKILGMDNIPQYTSTGNHAPEPLVNPQHEQNSSDSLHDQPAVNAEPVVLVTPQADLVTTGTESPMPDMPVWSDYIFDKINSKVLADNMVIAGKGEKPNGYAAHHVVPWGLPHLFCEKSRKLLSRNGIGINDAENGVYLPTRRSTKNDKESYHPEIHTKNIVKIYSMY